MHSLDLCQLRSLGPVRKHYSVAAEIALMRARKIITGAVPALVIACLQLGRFINGLVNPVPDAAAYDTGRIADRLPVKVQIADCIAHCVSVFADEHRLVKTVGVLIHPLHVRIHLGIEIAVCTSTVRQAAYSGSLIMYRPAVQ